MFTGFTQETVDFMWGIRFNNDRTWFNAHKQQYLNVFYQPMRALADEVYERFMDAHSTLDLNCRVSRIYRDARRLHGRGPYKDRLWWSMERPGEEWTSMPVFWFELKPESYSYGMGFYQAPPLTMAKFRACIDHNPAPMEQLARRFQKQDVFLLEGVDYKRSKGSVSPVLAPWYNKRGFSLIHEQPHDDLLWSHDLADRLIDGFEFLLPYYLYMEQVIASPSPTQM